MPAPDGYMSAGVPAIAPRHTAMIDYVHEDNAILVETSLEPAVCPQDPRERYRTMSHRLNLESLMDGFRQAYRIVKEAPERYENLSRQAVRPDVTLLFPTLFLFFLLFFLGEFYPLDRCSYALAEATRNHLGMIYRHLQPDGHLRESQAQQRSFP